MKIILVTFADSRLSRSVSRFRHQAELLNVFDGILSFSEFDIKEHFQSDFGRVLDADSRGFGYWAWKPWLIHKVLDGMEDNDVLVYADVGFHINEKGRDRFFDYVEMLHESPGVLGFQALRPNGEVVVDDGRSLPVLLDKYWAKGDLLDFLGVRNVGAIVDTPTIQAGLVFARKNNFSLEFMYDWFAFIRDHTELIDDSPSGAPNYRGFRESRHDQSVFSILGKLRSIRTVSSNEFWMPKRWASIGDWKALSRTPFHARRDLDFGDVLNAAYRRARFRRLLRPSSLLLNMRLLIKRVMNVFRPVSRRSL